MMPLRTVAAVAVSAAVAGLAARAFAPAARETRREASGAPAPPARQQFSAAVPANVPAPGTPAPKRQRSAARPRVPAGILTRAAEARALERGPSCAPATAPGEPPRCAPEQRPSIEIEWHVARDR